MSRLIAASYFKSERIVGCKKSIIWDGGKEYVRVCISNFWLWRNLCIPGQKRYGYVLIETCFVRSFRSRNFCTNNNFIRNFYMRGERKRESSKFFVNDVLNDRCRYVTRNCRYIYIYWKIYIMNSKIVVKNIFLSPSFIVLRVYSFTLRGQFLFFIFYFFTFKRRSIYTSSIDRSFSGL